MLSAFCVNAVAQCADGLVLNSGSPIAAFAMSPSGSDLYSAVRLSIVTQPPRFALEHRSSFKAMARQIYVTDSYITDVAADDSYAYIVDASLTGDRLVLRLDSAGGQPATLASYPGATDLHLDVSGDSVYVVFPSPTLDGFTGRVIRPSQIVRIPTDGGEGEPVVAWTAFVLPDVAFDSDNVYYALGDFAGAYVVFKYSKTSREAQQLGVVTGLRSLAVDDGWLYAATSAQILRVPVEGGTFEPLFGVHDLPTDTGWFFDSIEVTNGRIVARQTGPVRRGCSNTALVEYTLGGALRVLSTRPGLFLLRDQTVLHAPGDCALIAPRPPFVMERFCLAPGRRRSVH